jgi:hypothetical protein
MVAEMLFHLGDRKAGSTAIQMMLTARAWAPGDGSAPERWLFYPGKGHHNGLAQALLLPDSERDRRFRPVAAALAASSARLGVISAEDFETVPPEVFARMLAEIFPDHAATARLVAYVRPHVARFGSIWAERVKAGRWQGPPEAWLDAAMAEGLLSYTPRFLAWRERFGPRFELRPMIRERLAGGDVVQDFLGVALRTPAVPTGTTAWNVSPGLEDLAVLDSLHRGLGELPAALRAIVGRRLARELAAAAAPGTRPGLGRALVDRLAGFCRADAAALDAAFFAGAPMTGALAEAVATAPAQTPQAALGPGAARLGRVFAGATQGLLAGDPAGWRLKLRALRQDELAGLGAEADDEGDDEAGGAAAGARTPG